MKVLIWIGCIVLNALITTLLQYAGIRLGAIPAVLLFSATPLWLANFLCKKWDEHQVDGQMGWLSANKTRFCRRCGTAIPKGETACLKCRVPIKRETTAVCYKCNHKIPSDCDYCQCCGVLLDKNLLEENTEIEKASKQKAKEKKCVNKKERKIEATKTIKNTNSNKMVNFYNKYSIVSVSIAIVALIFAIGILDSRHRDYTLVMWLSGIEIVLLSGYLLLLIQSLKKQRYKLCAILSFIFAAYSLLMCVCTDVFADGYWYMGFGYVEYTNAIATRVFYGILLACVAYVFVVSMITLVCKIIRATERKRKSSLRYKERCYKKAEKFLKYLEKGIITNEEYEEIKREILEKINKD